METTHPGLDVQEPVLGRQVLIFTSYQAVAVIALPNPLRQCPSSNTLRIMEWKNISTACIPKTYNSVQEQNVPSLNILSAAHIHQTYTRNAIIIGFRPSMKTMDCTLKRVLIKVFDDCVTRSLSGSSCCKHHRWRLYHLEYSGNLLQSVFLSSLFVTGNVDRLPLLLPCEQHAFKMGVLLLFPPMC